MIDFIEVKNYEFVYYTLLLIFVMLMFLDSKQSKIEDFNNLKKKNMTGIVLMVIVVLYLGLRPITFNYFGDMGMYNNQFESYAAGEALKARKDMGFEIFIKACSQIMTPQMFFLLCAFLYIYPLYRATKNLFKEYWYYAFLVLLASFTFWGYGTNGIRNGLATTFFVYAISLDKRWATLAFIALAASFHGSLLIPAAAYVLTMFYKKTQYFFYFWLLTIPASVVLGGFWENFFFSLGFGEEERLEGYLSDIGKYDEEFSQTGFRWDFLLYSAAGVVAGWYFVLKRKYEDELYVQLFNIYLFVNGFWVLVIRANYSNRFAYLSWFMLGLIIIYPYLKKQFFVNQHEQVGKIILIYFSFSYVLNALLK